MIFPKEITNSSFVVMPGEKVRELAERTLEAIQRRRERDKNDRIEKRIEYLIEWNRKLPKWLPKWFHKRIPTTAELRAHFYDDMNHWISTFDEIDDYSYADDFAVAKRLAKAGRHSDKVLVCTRDFESMGRWHAEDVLDRMGIR